MLGNRLLCGASHYSGYSGYSFQKLDAPTAIAEAPAIGRIDVVEIFLRSSRQFVHFLTTLAGPSG